ncbi:unnamed protein product [Linum trigynum]|uniref:Uncharacterized protein n=1 Tax=Linum trigynum TaxID=586398 RepID=A0AAV2DGT1_9ROSI
MRARCDSVGPRRCICLAHNSEACINGLDNEAHVAYYSFHLFGDGSRTGVGQWRLLLSVPSSSHPLPVTITSDVTFHLLRFDIVVGWSLLLFILVVVAPGTSDGVSNFFAKESSIPWLDYMAVPVCEGKTWVQWGRNMLT